MTWQYCPIHLAEAIIVKFIFTKQSEFIKETREIQLKLKPIAVDFSDNIFPVFQSYVDKYSRIHLLVVREEQLVENSHRTAGLPSYFYNHNFPYFRTKIKIVENTIIYYQPEIKSLLRSAAQS